jgi:hypothetical protein
MNDGGTRAVFIGVGFDEVFDDDRGHEGAMTFSRKVSPGTWRAREIDDGHFC